MRKTFNPQNTPEERLNLWAPAAGEVLLVADWIQIEAALTGFFACDEEMTQVVLSGQDLHAINAAAMWYDLDPKLLANWMRITVNDAARLIATLVDRKDKASAEAILVQYQGRLRTCRYATKRTTHGANYLMGPLRLAQLNAWPVKLCEEKISRYHTRWPQTRRWQLATVKEAMDNGYLALPSGRKRYFWSPVEWCRSTKCRRPKYGERIGPRGWPEHAHWKDAGKAVSLRPQGMGAHMLKWVLKQVPDEWLWATDHDSITLAVHPSVVRDAATLLHRLMSHRFEVAKWDRFYPEGFWCRVKMTTGPDRGEQEELKL